MNATRDEIVALLRSALENEGARTPVDGRASERLESSLRRVRRRHRLVVAAAACATAVALIVGSVAAARLDLRRPQRDLANTATGARLAASTANASPNDIGTAITTGFGALWVVLGNGASSPSHLVTVDAVTGRVERSTSLPSRYIGDLAAGAGAVWAADRPNGTLLQIDPRTTRIIARIARPGIEGIAVAAGSVWIGSGYTDDVVRIDPVSHRLLGRVRVGPSGSHRRLFADGSSLWVTERGGLDRIDTRTATVTARLRIPDYTGDTAAAVEHRTAWLSDITQGLLLKVDAVTGRMLGRFPVCAAPRSAVATAAGVWVICVGTTGGEWNPSTGEVALVDPAHGAVVARRNMRGVNDVAAASGTGVWVAGHSSTDLLLPPARR